jgi:hypothetical protein
MKTQTLIHSQQTLRPDQSVRHLTLSAFIKRYTTDSLGIILADAAVPVADQKPYPFHLFGEFDRVSGYPIADGIANRFNTNLFSVYTVGIGTPLFFFNPAATINSVLKKGDIVFLYVDDLNAPAVFTFIVITAASGGFASLVNESNITQISAHGWGVFEFDSFLYAWDADVQLRQPFILVHTKFDGDFKFDYVNPLQFRYTTEKEPVKQIRIPLKMLVNQYNGLSGFLDFASSGLHLLFELHI